MDISINSDEIDETIYRKDIHYRYKPTYFNKNCLHVLKDNTTAESEKKITKICFKESGILPKNVYIVPKNQDSDIEDELYDFIKINHEDSDNQSDEESDSKSEENYLNDEEEGYEHYEENDDISEFSE